MHTHSSDKKASQAFTKRRIESESADQILDLLLLIFAQRVEA